MVSRRLLYLACSCALIAACSTAKFAETTVHIPPPANIAAEPARKLPKMRLDANTEWYPAQAKREGMTGRVLVQFEIDPAGRVRGEQILAADAVPLLLDAALKSIRGSEFDVAGLASTGAGPYRVTVRYCLPDCGSIEPFAGTEDLKISGSPVSKR